MSRMLARFLLVVAIALAAAALPTSAYAKPSKQDIALAKKAEREAKKHEKKGDFEEAREAWQKAVELNDTAAARIGLARAETKLGHLLVAEEHLNKALEHKKLNWGQKRKVKKELDALEKKIPTLQIEPPSDFSGTITVNDDQKEVSRLAEPLRLDPGQHTVVAKADGYKTFSETVVLEEGDRKDLVILMTEIEKPAPAAPLAEDEPEKGSSSSTQKTLGWISIGVGVVGLGVGTYMGLKARSTRSELDDRCGGNACSEADRELYDDGKQQADISTVGFIVGGAGIGLGTVLLLTAGSGSDDAKAERAGVQPVIGPGQLGVRGRF